jgi:hypothetical protein
MGPQVGPGEVVVVLEGEVEVVEQDATLAKVLMSVRISRGTVRLRVLVPDRVLAPAVG